MGAVNFAEEIDFQKYWLVLKRRWWIALGVFGIVVAISVLTTSKEETVYVAGGKILINPDRSLALTGLEGLEDLGEIQGLTMQSDPIATESEVVRSRPIAEKTVEALNLKDEEGKPLNPRAILSELNVEPVPGTDVMRITYMSDDPDLAAAVVNKTMEIYVKNDIEINQTKAVTVRQFLEEQIPQTEARVSQAEEDLRIFKEDNKVVSLIEEAKRSVEVIALLDNEIAQTKADLAKVSSQSAELQNQIGFNPAEAVAASSLSQSIVVQDLLEQLTQVKSELAIERTRYTQKHPKIKNLERKVAALQEEFQEHIGLVLGDSRSVAALAPDQDDNTPIPLEPLQFGEVEQKQVAQFVNLDAERLGLASQVTVLSQTRDSYKARTDSFPELEQKQSELERRLEVARSTYEILLSKFQEAQAAEKQSVGKARIISPSTAPEHPVPSKRKIFIAAYGVAGVMLGIAMAFLVDLIDGSVKNVKEARELFGYTLLGIIPFSKPKKTRKFFRKKEEKAPSIVVRDFPHSPISASYQMLQANLKFLSSDKRIKTIVVTSSVPKEGKSEISANLAAAIAQIGRRVLLVDADMRDPSQHHIWQLTNMVGLSHVLVGEAELNNAIEEVMPKLDVLSAGVIPPNPVALLDSKRMASLIEGFSNEYDSIIFDTPPLAGIADAPILGKMTDGILLVVRPKIIDASGAKAAKEFLTQSGQNVLGLVANGVIINNEPDSYFYYTKEQYGAQTYAKQQKAKRKISIGKKRS